MDGVTINRRLGTGDGFSFVQNFRHCLVLRASIHDEDAYPCSGRDATTGTTEHGEALALPFPSAHYGPGGLD